MTIPSRKRRFQRARDTLTLTLHQRCFYLFCALLLVLMSVPFLEGSPRGRIVLVCLNLTVLIAGAAAIGRGAGALLIGLLLAVPAAICMVVGQIYDARGWVILSNAFSAAFYFVTISYLASYALRRDVLTMDKLYGAAAGDLMLGALWGYFYFILLWFHPGALVLN
ncbi:MAG TPA: voltage-gated potassium channel, partial [Burkholderiales bacterium]